MADVHERRMRFAVAPLHPAHAFLLACSVPLFAGALLSDIAYSKSFEIQWKNFASWLIPGALLFLGIALLWAIVDLFRAGRRESPNLLYALLLASGFVLGLVNAFVHGKDAWASMPAGLILSLIGVVLAIWAAWLAFSTLRAGAVR